MLDKDKDKLYSETEKIAEYYIVNRNSRHLIIYF